MDLVKTARILRKRWYAAAIGCALTFVAVAMVLLMPPKYEAKTVLALLAPNTPPPAAAPSEGKAAPVNPYQSFDSSITITADLMSTQLTQPQVVDDLVRRGASSTFTVTPDLESGGPTVTITAEAPTAAQALTTTRLVTAEFRRQLESRQIDAGAPKSTLITATSIATPTRADRLVSGRVKALVAVLGVGLTASIVLALLVEGLSQSRQNKRRRVDRLESTGPIGEGADPDGDQDPVHGDADALVTNVPWASESKQNP